MKNYFTFFITIFFILSTVLIFPQTTRTSAGSGNWNIAATWSPSGVPGVGDVVIIAAGHTVTVNDNTANLGSLTVNGILTLGNSVTGRTVNVNGDVTVGGSVNFSNNNAIHTFNIGGNLINNGSIDFFINQNRYCNTFFTGNSLISGNEPKFYNLTINSGSSLSLDAPISIGGSFVNNGTFSPGNEHITIAGSVNSGFTFPGFTTTGNVIFTRSTGTTTFTGNVNANELEMRGGGTLNLGSNLTHTFTGGLTRTNGTLNCATSTIKFGGDVDLTAGITAASGTIEYNGNGNQTIAGISYRNLIVSGSGVKSRSSGTITVNDTLFMRGTATIGIAITYSSAVLVYNGSAAQTTSSEFISPFTGGCGVVIDNPNGVTLNGAKTFSSNNSYLTLLNGRLITSNSNSLTFTTSATLTYFGEQSYIDGPLAGRITTGGTHTLFFPIGKGVFYRPLQLEITQGIFTYTCEVFNNAPASRNLPGDLDLVSTVRYWNITKSGSGNVTGAKVTLYYGEDDGVTDTDFLRIAKDDGAGNWINLGGTGTGTPTGSITSTVNFTTFSDFVLANAVNGSNPLPVELASFTAKILKNQGVQLNWKTETEVNNYGFEVHRLEKNNNWLKIGFVEGNGNSNTPKEYSFTDKVTGGKYSYRLKQIDNDGKFEFSRLIEVSIEMPTKFELDQNYPNPFNPVTTISFSLPEAVKVSLTVYNLLGQQVAELVNELKEAGEYSVQFDAAELNSGVYIYKITAGNFSETRKMMLLK